MFNDIKAERNETKRNIRFYVFYFGQLLVMRLLFGWYFGSNYSICLAVETDFGNLYRFSTLFCILFFEFRILDSVILFRV